MILSANMNYLNKRLELVHTVTMCRCTATGSRRARSCTWATWSRGSRRSWRATTRCPWISATRRSTRWPSSPRSSARSRTARRPSRTTRRTRTTRTAAGRTSQLPHATSAGVHAYELFSLFSPICSIAWLYLYEYGTCSVMGVVNFCITSQSDRLKCSTVCARPSSISAMSCSTRVRTTTLQPHVICPTTHSSADTSISSIVTSDSQIIQYFVFIKCFGTLAKPILLMAIILPNDH